MRRHRLRRPWRRDAGRRLRRVRATRLERLEQATDRHASSTWCDGQTARAADLSRRPLPMLLHRAPAAPGAGSSSSNHDEHDVRCERVGDLRNVVAEARKSAERRRHCLRRRRPRLVERRRTCARHSRPRLHPWRRAAKHHRPRREAVSRCTPAARWEPLAGAATARRFASARSPTCRARPARCRRPRARWRRRSAGDAGSHGRRWSRRHAAKRCSETRAPSTVAGRQRCAGADDRVPRGRRRRGPRSRAFSRLDRRREPRRRESLCDAPARVERTGCDV